MATTKMGEVIARAVRPWLSSLLQELHNETASTRLRTGRTHFTRGYFMSQGVQRYGEACLDPLTVRHLLVECPVCGTYESGTFPEVGSRTEVSVSF